MFHKALWLWNWKQTRIMLGIMFVVLFMSFPFYALVSMEGWRDRIERIDRYTIADITARDIYNVFVNPGSGVFMVFVLVILAGMMIGLERNTRKHDFLLSWPFHRRDIFFSKWLMGTLAIITFFVFNVGLAYIIVSNSEFAPILNDIQMTSDLIVRLIGFILFFTFALLIGTIAGEMISQVILTLIFSVLPFGLIILIDEGLRIHTSTTTSNLINYYEWISYITLPYYMVLERPYQSDLSMYEPFILETFIVITGTVIFLILGMFLYERNKVEHNGEFLIFKLLQPVLNTGIVVCFGLLGGMFIRSFIPFQLSNGSLFGIFLYWIGFNLFAFFAYLLVRRLQRMNITLKSKT
ncbi:ABC transporter permease [Texcoconibacillus texcoconensis]|uniref:ABC-2 type transport system permease protein n=1 Tax=Texcoconibacillus texcoconensis TaxID=1095777 RepID=A0A840QPF1_9BACI|nr:ABC transporter permease [Texcoconibacillus texcoconensis]MBB5173286.1 ABC-2 type transport system permease protein [Texcoconibacillus texcoconensis]